MRSQLQNEYSLSEGQFQHAKPQEMSLPSYRPKCMMADFPAQLSPGWESPTDIYIYVGDASI